MDAGFLWRLGFALLLCLAVAPAASASTALVCQGIDAGLARAISDRLKNAGFAVEAASYEGLPAALAGRPDILVLPNARRYPAEALAALQTHLERGGSLLTVGGPAFEDLLVRQNGKWLTKAEAQQAFVKEPPNRLLFDFKTGDEKRWEYGTNHPEFEQRLSVKEGALAGFVSDVQGWSVYLSEPLEQPFAPGHSMTVFEARGDRNTPRLTVEWRERDGSRWMADVRLSEKWTRFALAPSDFRYWPDNSSDGRGGQDDCFRPENAVRFSMGLTENAGPLPRGTHIYWVRGFGTSSDRIAEARVPAPRLDTLSPSYKVYPMRGVRRLSARPDQALVETSFVLSGRFDGVMPVWRARGLGAPSNGLPPVRFIPCVDAFDRDGEWRGTAAWMLVHFEGKYAGGRWGAVGVAPDHLSDAERDSLADLASAMASRMLSKPFIRSAGSEPFALRAGESPAAFKVGCWAAGGQTRPATVRTAVTLVQEAKELELHAGDDLAAEPGALVSWEKEGISCFAQPGPGRIITRLIEAGNTIDMVSQPVSILPAASGGPYVAAESGQFTLAGVPFYANGVNYWPRSRIALETDELSPGWLSAWRYDPEVIERDLQTLEGLRVNLVSIQYMDPVNAPQLVDFLERCRHHRILANIFLDFGHPLHPNLPKLRELIEAAGLAENAQVFAYDVAWEPTLGKSDRRSALDGQWNDWIIEQYGTLERAERDWGVTAPRNSEGGAASPSDEQISTDGEARKMVAAYRRFADDLISRGYGAVTRLVRSVDANHLIGVRTGWGGTGQPWPVPAMPFDLASGAAHLDFTSPEGYGLSGDLDSYLAAGFTTEYGRLVSGGKPVFWAEYGQSIWPDSYGQESLKLQAEHYKKNYEMFLRSHANGSAAWWWPGGFRVEEGSDYGLVHQDCEPRPAARVLSERAQQAAQSLKLPPPAATILIDRDLHVSGYAGVWAAARNEYLAHLRAGRRASLRTQGTGSTSANCPAVAVGGVPWTGDNPSKFLNAEICCPEAGSGSGWAPCENGSVPAAPAEPLRIRVLLTNTGEAKWLASGDGAVSLKVRAGEKALDVALSADVESLESAGFVEADLPPLGGGTVELRITCAGRGEFGQRLTLRVEPRE